MPQLAEPPGVETNPVPRRNQRIATPAGRQLPPGRMRFSACTTPRIRQRSTSLMRVIRGQASGGNQNYEAPHWHQCPCFPPEASSSPPTGLAGMLMQPWNPWVIKPPEFLT